MVGLTWPMSLHCFRQQADFPNLLLRLAVMQLLVKYWANAALTRLLSKTLRNFLKVFQVWLLILCCLWDQSLPFETGLKLRLKNQRALP